METKKRLSPILLSAFIFILVLGGVSVFTQQKNEPENAPVVIQQETSTPSATPTVEPTNTPAAETAITITAQDSEFGQMLFDGSNQAIYIWEVETSSEPQCYDDCARAWPPVLTTGAPVAASGVDAALLSTVSRTDGTTQVTYNGHPLYYYADEGPGEVKCHNVSTHGGLWWVIQPNGIRAD